MLEVGKQELKWLPGKEEGCISIPLLHLPHPILYTASLFYPGRRHLPFIWRVPVKQSTLSVWKKILARKETGSFQVLCPQLKAL